MVSETTSQFCATICIHVPMLDVQAPNHCTRKSRYVNAASIRRMARAPMEGVGAGSVSVTVAARSGAVVTGSAKGYANEC